MWLACAIIIAAYLFESIILVGSALSTFTAIFPFFLIFQMLVLLAACAFFFFSFYQPLDSVNVRACVPCKIIIFTNVVKQTAHKLYLLWNDFNCNNHNSTQPCTFSAMHSFMAWCAVCKCVHKLFFSACDFHFTSFH